MKKVSTTGAGKTTSLFSVLLSLMEPLVMFFSLTPSEKKASSVTWSKISEPLTKLLLSQESQV
jgi:type II secretory ATPase GspE/PulE/Tfp pilus assembly ATPase PilB-like protein